MPIEQEKLAHEVRKTYFFERRLYEARQTGEEFGSFDSERRYPHWDGGTDARGVQHKPVWPRIVNFAQGRGIDPVELVRAVFTVQEHGKPPLPNQLAGPYALECYATFRDASVKNLNLDFEIHRRSAKFEAWKLSQVLNATPAQIWRLVITSPKLHCGPLFRYCLACSTGQTELAEYCKNTAMQEYMKGPDEFDRVISKYLPEDFRKEARQRRELLINR